MPQASASLGANGGILGAVVGSIMKSKDLEQEVALKKHLMDYQHGLYQDRENTRNLNAIVADQARQSTAYHFKNLTDTAAAKNKMDQIKEGGKQKRLSKSHENKSNLRTMEKMTAGLEKTAGLPLSGGISPLVAKAGEYQGQLQALKGHPHLGVNPEAATAVKPNRQKTGSQGAGRKRRTAPKPGAHPAKQTFADVSVSNVKPVPSNISNPFPNAAGN